MNLSNALFDSYFPSIASQAVASGSSLKVDIVENDKGYTVTADVPGYSRDDLEVEFNDGILKLEARIQDSTGEAQKDEKGSRRYVYRERHSGRQARSFRFADDVDGKKIDAKLTDGVLEVFIPKAAREKQRLVAIK